MDLGAVGENFLLPGLVGVAGRLGAVGVGKRDHPLVGGAPQALVVVELPDIFTVDQQVGDGQQAGGPDMGGQAGGNDGGPDVVDADYTVVDDDNK